MMRMQIAVEADSPKHLAEVGAVVIAELTTEFAKGTREKEFYHRRGRAWLRIEPVTEESLSSAATLEASIEASIEPPVPSGPPPELPPELPVPSEPPAPPELPEPPAPPTLPPGVPMGPPPSLVVDAAGEGEGDE